MKLTTLLLISLFLFGCNTEKGLVGKRGLVFGYDDPKFQSDVIELLQQSDIDYIVEGGVIVTLMKDTAEVRSITRIHEYGGNLDPDRLESEVILSELHEEILTKRLHEAGISYFIDSMAGDRHVVWRLAHAEAVDQIVEEVDFEFYEASKSN
jgi:hypothetical protein